MFEPFFYLLNLVSDNFISIYNTFWLFLPLLFFPLSAFTSPSFPYKFLCHTFNCLLFRSVCVTMGLELHWDLVSSPVGIQLKEITASFPESVSSHWINREARGPMSAFLIHTYLLTDPFSSVQVSTTTTTVQLWLQWLCHTQTMAFCSLSP